MKRIKLTHGIQCTQGEGPLTGVPEISDDLWEAQETFQWNAGQVVFEASAIERQARAIFIFYFRPKNWEVLQRAFLQTDFFGFASMVKSLAAIQEAESILEPKDWKKLEKDLKSTMHRRNMLAHGDFTFGYKGEELVCEVEYFSGTLQKKIFDDAEWDRTSKRVKDANQGLIRFQIGVHELPK